MRWRALCLSILLIAGCGSEQKTSKAEVSPTPAPPPLSTPPPTANPPQVPKEPQPFGAQKEAAQFSFGWRGDGSGIYQKSDPPLNWDEKRNVKWFTRIGDGFSSPAVCGDYVFVTVNAGDTTPPMLICLSTAKGEIKWKAKLSSADVPDALKGAAKKGEDLASSCGQAAPTPICDGQNVYAVFGSGIVAAYSFDGNQRWVNCIEPEPTAYGHSSSPLLVDGKLILSLKNITALDPATGKELWKSPNIDPFYGSPAALKTGNDWLVVTPLGAVVRAKDGVLLGEKIAENLGGDEFGISPTASGDVVYLGDRNTTAVKLGMNGDKLEVQKLWTVELPEAAFASVVVTNGLLFYVGKRAKYAVLDAATGKSVLEQTLKIAPAGGEDPEHPNANMYPSISLAGGKLFISNDIGQTLLLEPTKEYQEVGVNKLPEGAGATPAFVGDRIYMRAGEFLYCIGK